MATGGRYELHIHFTENVHTYLITKKEYIAVQLTCKVQRPRA